MNTNQITQVRFAHSSSPSNFTSLRVAEEKSDRSVRQSLMASYIQDNPSLLDQPTESNIRKNSWRGSVKKNGNRFFRNFEALDEAHYDQEVYYSLIDHGDFD
jgi:hypothetical protein